MFICNPVMGRIGPSGGPGMACEPPGDDHCRTVPAGDTQLLHSLIISAFVYILNH